MTVRSTLKKGNADYLTKCRGIPVLCKIYKKVVLNKDIEHRENKLS